ncbi:MAG: hypothetical protein ACOY93_09265 [Bacillota bacterium]
MKLLLWLLPLGLWDSESDVQLEEIAIMPRSERFPGHPPHGDLPEDALAAAEWEREMALLKLI